MRTFLSGLWVGATMTVPGVSGGTMAMVVGIYEKLIHAVNNIWKTPKQQLWFLTRFVAGAGIGFVLLAKVISMLLANNVLGVPTQFLFCGVVIGGIPFIYYKSQIQKLSVKNIICGLVGIGIVRALAEIPQKTFAGDGGESSYFLQFFGGVIIAIALVLPGISVTHMLYILGIYEQVMKQVYSMEWVALLPLMLGAIAGTILTTRLLEWMLRQYTTGIYMMILGFVIGSIWELVPKETIYHPILCFLIAVGGFCSMYALTKRANKRGEENFIDE